MHYVFGDYSLDTQRYELRHTGELIPLGPQVFNVLAYLVAHCDRVVSHDELFARLWPDQFVTDDALGRCIRAARRALQDRPEAPRYITTTRKRGYRFIGLVGREVRYVEGHCLSYGNATPYLPVVDLVRQLCGMTPGEPHAAITAAVHRRLQQADLDPDEGVPLVLSLLDIPLETERLAPLPSSGWLSPCRSSRP